MAQENMAPVGMNTVRERLQSSRREESSSLVDRLLAIGKRLCQAPRRAAPSHPLSGPIHFDCRIVIGDGSNGLSTSAPKASPGAT